MSSRNNIDINKCFEIDYFRREINMSYLDHTVGAYIRRIVVFPVYWKHIKHAKVLQYYQQLQKHQWATREEISNNQRKKLYALILYSSQNIPYY